MLEVLSKIRNLNIDSEIDLNPSRNDFETFKKETISLINEETAMNDLMNLHQSFVLSNMNQYSNTFTYNDNFVKLDNIGLSLGVSMYNFLKQQ